MEHSEDEKKAIEDLKKQINFYDINNIKNTNSHILMKLIDKQHSKIKELADYTREWLDSYCEENQKWQKERNENGRLRRLVKNSIPKKVIREKIEELYLEMDRYQDMHAEKSVAYMQTYHAKNALEELLGE